MTLNIGIGACKMTQLSTKPAYLSSAPGTHMVEEENQLLQVVIWLPCVQDEVLEFAVMICCW